MTSRKPKTVDQIWLAYRAALRKADKEYRESMKTCAGMAMAEKVERVREIRAARDKAYSQAGDARLRALEAIGYEQV